MRAETQREKTHSVMIDFLFALHFKGAPNEHKGVNKKKKKPPRPPKKARNRLGMVGVEMVTKGARKTEQRLDEKWIA